MLHQRVLACGVLGVASGATCKCGRFLDVVISAVLLVVHTGSSQPSLCGIICGVNIGYW